MAKVAIIADTHFGCSNSSDYFLNYHESFFNDLIPILKNEGVTELIHLGDLYDIRKHINFKTLKKSFNFFTETMLFSGLNIHLIVGNHDAYYKNTIEVNSINELLGWTSFNIYNSPKEVLIGGKKFLMVPWICADNSEESLSMIDNSEADVCCGHFDISGFYIMKNVINQHGLEKSLFSKFKRTFSGHFHIPSQHNNIIYVGSPYELSWNDYGDTKRVIIYDTEIDKLYQIDNHARIFEKIFYNKDNIESISVNNKIIKVYVNQEDNGYDFDLFIKGLQSQSPYLLSIIENANIKQEDENVHEFIKKDTLEFLTEYIDETESENSYELKVLMNELYTKAKEK